jgi:hypothetical protein
MTDRHDRYIRRDNLRREQELDQMFADQDANNTVQQRRIQRGERELGGVMLGITISLGIVALIGIILKNCGLLRGGKKTRKRYTGGTIDFDFNKLKQSDITPEVANKITNILEEHPEIVEALNNDQCPVGPAKVAVDEILNIVGKSINNVGGKRTKSSRKTRRRKH